MRLLTGVTHALVTIPNEHDAKETGTMALVDLCFGQGDAAISGLRYVKADGQMAWHAPAITVYRGGRNEVLPVFKGALLLEVCKLASAAVARIKKELGRPAWDKQYLVLKDRVVVQDPQGKEQV